MSNSSRLVIAAVCLLALVAFGYQACSTEAPGPTESEAPEASEPITEPVSEPVSEPEPEFSPIQEPDSEDQP
jgi:hypothetical protein